MGFWLLVFFLTPIIEMYLLIRVGGYIGAVPTIVLVMLTAVIGVALLRVQGLATLTRGMSRLEGGELPAREMAEGILLAVAGALLVTPGFVTDAMGFLLLLPATRAAAARRLLERVVVRGVGPGGRHPGESRPGSDASGPTVIEGQFQSRTEDERHPEPSDDPPRRPSV
jgi:UPF0716 protein FxsA